MLVIPAVDLRDGRCVQLVGGRYDREAVRLEDPVAVARGWAELGFPWLHVVDLDAALGRGSNAGVIAEILREVDIDVQVGGGVRTDERFEALLAEGAARIVLGTRAFEDSWWLESVAAKYPEALVVACDVRDRHIVTHGWTRTTPQLVLDAVDDLNRVGVAGLLVTAVHAEGQMKGTDLTLMEDVAEASTAPVFASGGVGTVGDLRALQDRGVAGCVVGMALYTGALDARLVAEEFGQ